MKTIFITGGTGFVGSFLIPKLIENGYKIILSSRSKKDLPFAEVETVDFLKLSLADQTKIIEKSDGIINLAGASIADGKWTPERKKILIESRVDFTQAIATAIDQAEKKPDVFISASAVGYYGDRNDEVLTESASPGNDFLADLCKKWEQASEIKTLETRRVNPRIGIVLHGKHGALAKMLTPYHFFAGGPLASGSQYMPWVHIDDLVDMFVFTLETSNLKGAVNFTAPQPVTSSEFASEIGKVLNRPSFFKVPEFALKMILGEAAMMVTQGQRAVPRKLEENGYNFIYSNLQKALNNLLGR